MKKIYILFMACALAFVVSSCSKDDNGGSTPSGGGGGGNNTVDVWANIQGTFVGDEVTSTGGTVSNVKITITKISDTKVRIVPGANSQSLVQLDIPIFKGDTSVFHQQGVFNGSFFVIANSNPPQVILDDKDNNVSYSGLKE